MRLDVLNLVPKYDPPDYDRSVLNPLHEVQREEAAKLAALTKDCEAKGGRFSDGECVMPPPPPIPTPEPKVAPAAPVLSGGDAQYKLYIYNHESGNNPTQWNSEGCLGLGQSCPASKLLAVCPTMGYACEDNFFDGYATQRFGSWRNAYLHWLDYHSW